MTTSSSCAVLRLIGRPRLVLDDDNDNNDLLLLPKTHMEHALLLVFTVFFEVGFVGIEYRELQHAQCNGYRDIESLIDAENER